MSDKFGFLPAAIRPWVVRALAWLKSLTRPAKVLVASTVVSAALLVAYLSVRSANTPYAILFANLERDDAAAVVAKLKEMKVPYRLEGDGATIEVPEAQSRELRLELAGAGLPRGGSVGFESFDKMRLGATEFEQRILYRRALEGELARTIGSLSSVQSARVHLVLPEKSVFVAKNEPASASIVLKLRAGRALGTGEVAGVVHLVASSVAGLTVERVAVVTTEGVMLHRPKKAGEDGAGGSDEEGTPAARALESTLEERARAMVEKFVGIGRADVRVSAEVDTSRVERVEDHYDPNKVVMRSEERSVEHAGGEEVTAAGVPGAESNLPTGAAHGAIDGGAPVTGPQRESHTRNFEVDHVSEKRTTAAGTLRRLTVAVVVDEAATPRSKEELEKITQLVRSAVGADEKRGDVVTVEAMPFMSTAEPPAPAPPAPLMQQIPWKRAWPYGAIGAGGFVVLLFFVILLTLSSRKKKRKKKAVEDAKAAAALVTPAATPEEEEEPQTPEDVRRLVHERVASDPATAALVLRSWLGQHDESEKKKEAA